MLLGLPLSSSGLVEREFLIKIKKAPFVAYICDSGNVIALNDAKEMKAVGIENACVSEGRRGVDDDKSRVI